MPNNENCGINVNIGQYALPILQMMVDGFWVVNADQEIIETNDAYIRMSGYSRDELLKLKISDLDPDENPDITAARILRIMSNGFETFETRHRRKNGTFFDVEISANFMETDEKVFLCFCRDITSRKRIEEALLETENRFRAAFMVSPIAISISTLEGSVFIDVNQAVESLLGYSREEIIGKSAVASNLWVDINDRKRIIESIAQTGDVRNQQVWCRRRDGTKFLASISAKLLIVKDTKQILFAAEDITERVQSEKIILDSLKEKESLLREIHHRVKNNLAVISSLIGLQVRQVKDERIREMFDVCQHRIKTMALIHERLYRSADISTVHFQEYIHHLAEDLITSYHRPDGKDIQIEVDADQIFLDIDTAIPCGLIINELLTNTFKHAFWDTVEPKISIKFHKTEADTYTLTVQDNGIGMHYDFNDPEATTLGLMLVHALTRQLKGEVRFHSGGPYQQGTVISIIFKARTSIGKPNDKIKVS